MGYYTEHSLEILEGNDHKTDHEAGISKLAGYDYCFGEEIKWYNCEEDIREYSKGFPDTAFCLKGSGEENGDHWVEYYKNGKMHRSNAKIVYDDYDKDLLK